MKGGNKMFQFKEGTLKKGASVKIDGVEYGVTMPTYEGETPLSPENLNRAISECIKEFSILVKITADTAKGAIVTLSKKYKVGAGVLDVYLNGERLIKSSDEAGTDGHYTEVGTAGATSNQIKLTTDWNLSSGDYLEIIVRGEWS
jgi:hypothetical protein